MTDFVPLSEAIDPRVYGGKTASLARAKLAGLRVPEGMALSVAGVAYLPDEIGEKVERALPGPYAVRSSAPMEDGSKVSFAGVHATSLNVPKKFLEAAIREVEASAYSPAAEKYRKRLEVAGDPEMAVLIQTLVPSDISGVLFTRNPISGMNEYVIEAARGLGEVIAQGYIDPDRYVLTMGDEDPFPHLGHQTVMIQPGPVIGTVETEVETHTKLLLGADEIQDLFDLATECKRVFPNVPVLDIEWAIAGGKLYLLQVRPARTWNGRV